MKIKRRVSNGNPWCNFADCAFFFSALGTHSSKFLKLVCRTYNSHQEWVQFFVLFFCVCVNPELPLGYMREKICRSRFNISTGRKVPPAEAVIKDMSKARFIDRLWSAKRGIPVEKPENSSWLSGQSKHWQECKCIVCLFNFFFPFCPGLRTNEDRGMCCRMWALKLAFGWIDGCISAVPFVMGGSVRYLDRVFQLFNIIFVYRLFLFS